jgi:hypothetical protein
MHVGRHDNNSSLCGLNLQRHGRPAYAVPALLGLLLLTVPVCVSVCAAAEVSVNFHSSHKIRKAAVHADSVIKAPCTTVFNPLSHPSR